MLKTIKQDRLYLSQGHKQQLPKDYRCFRTAGVLEYIPICDDFGPMKLSHVFRFIDLLEAEMTRYPNSKIVYCIDDDKRALSNAAFLLGAFLLLKCDTTVKRIVNCFSWIRSNYEPFKDSTTSKSVFALELNDCWSALDRSMRNGWIACSSKPGIYGKYDLDFYEHYDNPLNAHMHFLIPGKIIAFKGPKDLGNEEFNDNLAGYRNFSPSYYIDIFRDLNVTAVIRLNQPEYDPRVFQNAGIRHYDLFLDEGDVPTPRLLCKFLHIVDAEPGVVAIHCKGGLGRTGTLIARLLMRSHRFTAREAMAWVRIVRPGSIVGEQQHYLVAVDSADVWHPTDHPQIRVPDSDSAAEGDPSSPLVEAITRGRSCSSLELPPCAARPMASWIKRGAITRDDGDASVAGPGVAACKVAVVVARPVARASSSFTFGATRRSSCPTLPTTLDPGRARDSEAARPEPHPRGEIDSDARQAAVLARARSSCSARRSLPEIIHEDSEEPLSPKRMGAAGVAPAAKGAGRGPKGPLSTAWLRGVVSAASSLAHGGSFRTPI